MLAASEVPPADGVLDLSRRLTCTFAHRFTRRPAALCLRALGAAGTHAPRPHVCYLPLPKHPFRPAEVVLLRHLDAALWAQVAHSRCSCMSAQALVRRA